MIDDLPWVVLAAMTILALLRITRTMRDSHRTRLSEKQKFDIAEAARVVRRRDDSTPTCPLCGKYNAERPFIRYAIDCHRDDCGDITQADPLAHEH